MRVVAYLVVIPAFYLQVMQMYDRCNLIGAAPDSSASRTG